MVTLRLALARKQQFERSSGKPKVDLPMVDTATSLPYKEAPAKVYVYK